ncbi:PhzF family phenazine biosynthesis protein [Streptomyces malaysiense]|uniref:Phenazine biosynthesis protein PhzF n=1 Tax=Streptomyces malaysiense TaxID=1428626 RepID=A0A1J4Q5U6_9ACTN|nr:PhzF family phenazine biosynthesis protein [Streptomyces malaysiense]OIK28361.1 hypothetical protein VT52_006800 [Streptomyces malaysiense]
MDLLRYVAFSSDPLGGNPAGVVLDAAGADEATMAATAAEVGCPETAFAVARPDGSLGIRCFSPRAEVSFWGHATIATAVAHASRHGVGRLLLHTRAGPVPVTTTTAPDGSVAANPVSVEPRTADLRDADLDYDMPALGALMARRGWTTIALVHRESDTVFHARNPFPPGGGHGVFEAPASKRGPGRTPCPTGARHARRRPKLLACACVRSSAPYPTPVYVPPGGWTRSPGNWPPAGWLC